MSLNSAASFFLSHGVPMYERITTGAAFEVEWRAGGSIHLRVRDGDGVNHESAPVPFGDPSNKRRWVIVFDQGVLSLYEAKIVWPAPGPMPRFNLAAQLTVSNTNLPAACASRFLTARYEATGSALNHSISIDGLYWMGDAVHPV